MPCRSQRTGARAEHRCSDQVAPLRGLRKRLAKLLVRVSAGSIIANMRSALLLALFLSQAMAADPSPSAIPWKRPERWEGALDKPKPKPAAVKNGDFSMATPDGKPEDWRPAYPTGTFSVVKEGNESFLRVEMKGEPGNAGAEQVIPVPPGSHTAVARGRMRGVAGLKAGRH